MNNIDVNKCRPQVLEHFVGQTRVVQRCKVALEAVWSRGGRLPHMLMQSGPGLGKTELCYVLSKEVGLNGEIHEQLAQNIKYPSDLHALLLTPKEGDMVLIDEIHELPPVAQTTLYRAMENQQIFLESAKGKKSRPLKIADYTIMAATTDPQKLLQPLRDRFKITLEFEHYTIPELETLLSNRCKQLAWIVDGSVLPEIAQRGKGVPRIALRLLESVKLTAAADNSDEITAAHFAKACELEGIDPIGLTINEIRYLQIVYENEGSARLNVIASRLSLHPRHVSNIIEHYLIREGLVTKSSSERVLTHKGLDHLRKYHQ